MDRCVILIGLDFSPNASRETRSGVNSPRRRAQTRRIAYFRWRILARIRRFLRPIFRRPLPVLFVPIPLAAFQVLSVLNNFRNDNHTVARQIGQTSFPLIPWFFKGKNGQKHSFSIAHTFFCRQSVIGIFAFRGPVSLSFLCFFPNQTALNRENPCPFCHDYCHL